MQVFEIVLILLVVAVFLTVFARRIGVPYPALLALAGTALALLPDAPEVHIDPELTLALFLAPVLLDAAYDTSLRDLRNNWIPVTSLVLMAVGVTTIAVACVLRWWVPAMPWSAAIALGAIVAPPDAAAATAVLRQLQLPHRVLVILEGESLLNDASALLIYRLAVGIAATHEVHLVEVAPVLLLTVAGSLVAGYVLARVNAWLLGRVEDPSSSIALQFASTFGVWILADRLGLSAIITVVVYALTAARRGPATPARRRVPSYAVWETAVFVLNVLAFVLIGLQLRPILATLEPAQQREYFAIAGTVLATVVVARLAWVMTYNRAASLKTRYFGAGVWPGRAVPKVKSGLVIGWCGMRGIVTLAAAYALPSGFPYRELIVLCAFAVVVGTLVIQGFTLRPLILLLGFKRDDSIADEVREAYRRISQVALDLLDGDHSPESNELRREFASLLDSSGDGTAPLTGRTSYDALRVRIVIAQRDALVAMRANDAIGDDAFHRIEERLDWAELNARAD